jgi:adenosine deaminase
MDSIYNTIHLLPKVNLHCHLSGSMRLTTLIELAKQENIQLPSTDPNTLNSLLKLGQQRDSLAEYLTVFDYLSAVMQTRQNLMRVAYELVYDSYIDNVVYLEIRYAPTQYIKGALSMCEVIQAVNDGINMAVNDLGGHIIVNVILCGMRQMSSRVSSEVAELVTFSPQVVGFDLAGPEVGFPASNHKEACKLVKHYNKYLTIHAGEERIGVSYIKDALDCGADRLGHGCQLINDIESLLYCDKKPIPIEICISSNIQTNAISHISNHPIWKYIQDTNLRLSINTDNSLVSNTTATNELVIVYNGLQSYIPSKTERLVVITNLIKSGIDSAFLHNDERFLLYNTISSQIDYILHTDH